MSLVHAMLAASVLVTLWALTVSCLGASRRTRDALRVIGGERPEHFMDYSPGTPRPCWLRRLLSWATGIDPDGRGWGA